MVMNVVKSMVKAYPKTFSKVVRKLRQAASHWSYLRRQMADLHLLERWAKIPMDIDGTSPCSDCISCWTENFWKCAESLHIILACKKSEWIGNVEHVCVSKHELYAAGLKCFVNIDSHTDSMRIEYQYCTNAWAHSQPNKSSRMALDDERKLYANPVNLVSYLIPLQGFLFRNCRSFLSIDMSDIYII